MYVKQIQIESLGNSSYVVGSEEAGVCAIVDPVRDVDMYIKEAEAQGMRITHTLETHVHNDFVSGSRELTARTGSLTCSSAAGGLLFDHRALQDGDSIELGEIRIDVIATPGHTPEHISFLATDTSKGGGPHALFSGGALLVGGVARSDLLGKDIAPFLGRWFHQTITQKLQPMDDDVVVYPTHGGGSFCLASPTDSSATITSIGQERATNLYFQAQTESDFLELAQSEILPMPRYYSRMASINVRGPQILGGIPELYPMSPREVLARIQGDSTAVDIRPSEAYATLHVQNSYSIPIGGSSGTWIGWLIEANAPLIILSDNLADREEIVRQVIRIGHDALEGYLESGIEAWQRAGLPTASVGTTTAQELFQQLEGGSGPTPLDVRFGYEWRTGHIPESVHIELGDLPEQVGTLAKDKSYATVCAAGIRASTAASVLERAGIRDATILLGGASAWIEAGYPLES